MLFSLFIFIALIAENASIAAPLTDSYTASHHHREKNPIATQQKSFIDSDQVAHILQEIDNMHIKHGAYDAPAINSDLQGLQVAESHPSLFYIPESLRYQVRDYTKTALLHLFSSEKDFHNAFARFNPLIGELLPTTRQLLTQATLFRFSNHFFRTSPKQLLGRFDVLAVPAKMDEDYKWTPYSTQNNTLFIHHAAAINIGERAHAADFQSYVNITGLLDEKKYLADMAVLLHCMMEAQERSGTTEAVWFPFGMGAFLRNLPLNDPVYRDAQALYELREKIAAAFIEAVKLHPALHIHLCLPTGKPNEHTTQNYNAFIQALLASPLIVKEQVTVYINVDSADLAQRLANLTENANKVSLANGANRDLIGNHWFDDRALQAIDENIHRRSVDAAAQAIILNGGIESRQRTDDELADRVMKYGGQSPSIR